MTRAERFAYNLASANARRPNVSFEGVNVFSDVHGNVAFAHGTQLIFSSRDRVPALIKFLRENFVRRDK